jgi:hypothetical protein
MSALPEQVFGMARKVHRVMKHAGDFDVIVPHSKQDGMSACQADATVRMKLRAQAPAGWVFGDLLKGSLEHGQIAVCLISIPGVHGVVIDGLQVFDGGLSEMKNHAACLRVRK